jgi:hypothetical protein
LRSEARRAAAVIAPTGRSVRQARDACHVEVDAEIAASALNQLAGK